MSATTLMPKCPLGLLSGKKAMIKSPLWCPPSGGNRMQCKMQMQKKCVSLYVPLKIMNSFLCVFIYIYLVLWLKLEI